MLCSCCILVSTQRVPAERKRGTHRKGVGETERERENEIERRGKEREGDGENQLAASR